MGNENSSLQKLEILNTKFHHEFRGIQKFFRKVHQWPMIIIMKKNCDSMKNG